MRKYSIIFLVLVLAFVAGLAMISAGDTAASPQLAGGTGPTPTPPLPGGGNPGCGGNNGKGLVASFGDIQDLKALNSAGYGNVLCTPNYGYGLSYTGWHNRGVGQTYMQQGHRYRFVPVVKSAADLNNYCNEWGSGTLPSYDGGIVIYGFWPSIPVSQGGTWQTAEQVGALAADILQCTPQVKLVGPLHHDTFATNSSTPQDWMLRMYNKFKADGGNVNALIAWGMGYYDMDGGGAAAQNITNKYWDMVKNLETELNIWALEIHGDRTDDALINNLTMHNVLGDDRVDRGFGYNVFSFSPNSTDMFNSVPYPNNSINNWGYGFRNFQSP